MSTDVISRLRHIGYAVRRSPSGEARAGRGGRGRRPATRSRFLAEGEQGAEASIFSCGWSLVSGQTYDFDGSERGPEPWALVQVTLGGSGILRREGREWICAAGSVLVLPLPDRHRYWLPRGGSWEFAYVSLRGAAPLRACARVLAGAGPVLDLGVDSALATSVLGAVADGLSEDLGPHALSERGYGVAMRLLEAADAERGGPALPEPYAALIDEACRIQVAPTVADLADLAGHTREHFTRVFRAHCGISPGRALADRRQRAAVEALRGGADLDAATAAAGLRSAPGLRRALRRRLGWSP